VNTPRQRLHPLTPLLRSARLLVVLVAAWSWQGFADLGLLRWLVAVAVLLAVLAGVAAVSWWFTGYQVAGRELRITEGVLWRRHRAIPLERLQAVDVVRPLTARLTGLAELRLEVVGGRHAEAPLAFLTVAHAEALRGHLLGLAGRPVPVPQPARDDPAPGRPGGGRPLFRVDNRDVVIGQLLGGRVWAIPLLVAAILFQFAAHPLLTFIGVASLLTALVGVFVEPVRRVLADWDFELRIDGGDLRLTHGLVETRSQTVPLRRVQTVELRRPLPWLLTGWESCRFEVAGYGAHDRQAGVHVDQLAPVGPAALVRRVAEVAVPGLALRGLALVPAPTRARWVDPLRQWVLGVALTSTALVVRDGLTTRRWVIAPYARVQSVRLVQGRLQRALGLASVHADTAGSLVAVARHRDLADARALAAALVERARAARAAEHGALDTPATGPDGSVPAAHAATPSAPAATLSAPAATPVAPAANAPGRPPAPPQVPAAWPLPARPVEPPAGWPRPSPPADGPRRDGPPPAGSARTHGPRPAGPPRPAAPDGPATDPATPPGEPAGPPRPAPAARPAADRTANVAPDAPPTRVPPARPAGT
jgi:putative membrane protein